MSIGGVRLLEVFYDAGKGRDGRSEDGCGTGGFVLDVTHRPGVERK